MLDILSNCSNDHLFVTLLSYISLICFSVLIYGSYTILIHLCEADGKLPFSSASMVLVTEVVKVGAPGLFYSAVSIKIQAMGDCH